jgi:hypothetical protein
LRALLADATIKFDDKRPSQRSCVALEGTMRHVSNLFAALLVLFAQTVSAQSNYPNLPVKILVGFTPG